MPVDLSRFLEELSANAWPAAVVQVVDGWRLRFNGGVTRRANSVWPNRAGQRLSLVQKLALAEDFYARRGTAARFQICPAAQPADLDDILVELGYTSDARTAVQTAPLARILARTESHPPYPVTVSDRFNRDWFDTYRHVEQIQPRAAEARRGILQRIGPVCGYALLTIEAQPVAVGLAVAERGWAGLFCMATQTEVRRRGAATAILHALARWAQEHHVTQLYLQVMEENRPAQVLYAKAGFETAYYYHYREAPQASH